ncbi:hypothetical protein [Sphingobium yanoikuyae]|uniref:hypothetical protein n=1 Tax=Sphingobium yanoikuyae TaxID=13690 RepID=UPI0026F2A4DD|nr:hypothetical protein [Sphingobium yanoikuyae]
MKASSPRKRGNRAWRRVEMPDENLPAVLKLLREAGPVFGKGDPVQAHSYFDAENRPRRLHATFADGWRATLVLHLNGTGSLSQALKLQGAIKGALPA